MNLSNIIAGICSLMFFMIGADKFFAFLEPPCSLMNEISPIIWKGLGALQLIAGVLIMIPKYRKPVVGFFFIFMLVFSVIHLTQGTKDVGGALFMATLLGLLIWNPSFLDAKTAA